MMADQKKPASGKPEAEPTPNAPAATSEQSPAMAARPEARASTQGIAVNEASGFTVVNR